MPKSTPSTDARSVLPLTEEEERAYPIARTAREVPVPAFHPPPGVGYNVPVRDIMTTPVSTARPTEPVGDVLERIHRLGIGGVPVVSRGKLVGIFSQSDLARLLKERTQLTPSGTLVEIVTDSNPELSGGIWKRHAGALRKVRVRDAMTPDPITVAPDVPVEKAARLMTEERVHRLPVVEGGRLVGIVTPRDFSRAELGAAREGRKTAALPR